MASWSRLLREVEVGNLWKVKSYRIFREFEFTSLPAVRDPRKNIYYRPRNMSSPTNPALRTDTSLLRTVFFVPGETKPLHFI